MGGRGSSSGISASGVGGVGRGGGGGAGSTSAQQMQPQQSQAQVQQAPNTMQTSVDDLIDASKIPSVYGNNTVDMFKNMSDDEMAMAVGNSIGVDMPNHLRDVPNSTQEFTFANGINKKATILNDSDFDDYIKNNKIDPNTEMLIREVNPVSFTVNGVNYRYSASDVSDMIKMSDLQYIGGKQGGSAYGYGLYMGMGSATYSTGYGRGADGVGHKSIMAVFDKSKAKAIYDGNISSKWNSFSQTHPKTAKVVRMVGGDTRSIKALLMGYNVITSNRYGSLKGRWDEYYNILDRSCLVMRANNRK